MSGLISSSNTKCRIIDEKGKPRKLKLDRVVAASDSHKKAAAIAKKATSLASGIDLGIAWEAAKGESLSFESLAMRLFPKESVVEASAALRLAHSRQRAYFLEKGGILKPVGKIIRDKIKASEGQRKKRKRQEASWEAALDGGKVPKQLKECMEKHLRSMGPDNERDFRFLASYCKRNKKSMGILAVDCGIFNNMEELHLHGILSHYPPARNVFQAAAIEVPSGLPALAKDAVSIDSKGTTEIDDVFAARKTDGGKAVILICIAAPALGLDEISEQQAGERKASLYLPGEKHRMLPGHAIDAYSLVAPGTLPVLALEITTDPALSVIDFSFKIGRVGIAANLNIEDFGSPKPSHPGIASGLQETLRMLGGFANGLHAQHARKDHERGHLVTVENGVPSIIARSRFSEMDDLVASLMIHYNTAAAKYLAGQDVCFLGRDKGRLVVFGEGKNKDVGYGWFTSPLRRQVDLVNQRQLLAAINNKKPPYTVAVLKEMVKGFDKRYEWVRHQQRRMEKYWILKHLESSVGKVFPAVATSRAGKLLLDEYPLHVEVKGKPSDDGAKVAVRLDRIDTYNLVASGTLA